MAQELENSLKELTNAMNGTADAAEQLKKRVGKDFNNVEKEVDTSLKSIQSAIKDSIKNMDDMSDASADMLSSITKLATDVAKNTRNLGKEGFRGFISEAKAMVFATEKASKDLKSEMLDINKSVGKPIDTIEQLKQTLIDLSSSFEGEGTKAMRKLFQDEIKSINNENDLLIHQSTLLSKLTALKEKAVDKGSAKGIAKVESSSAAVKGFSRLMQLKKDEHAVTITNVNAAKELLSASEKDVALHDRMVDVMKKVGPQMEKMLSPITDLQKRLRTIPILGDMIANKIGKIKDELITGVVNSIARGTAEGKNFGQIMVGVFKDMNKADLLFGAGVLVLVGLLSMALSLWTKYNEANKAIIKNTGLAASQTKELVEYVKDVNYNYAQLGVTAAIAGEATSAIVNEFVSLDATSKDLVKYNSLLSGVLGLSADGGAKLLMTLTASGQMSDKMAGKFTIATAQLAKANGVAPKKVLSDMAQSSAEIAKYFGGVPVMAANAAIEMAKIGLSVKEAANLSEKLLEWDTSIESEMNASVMLGKNLNFQHARELAFKKNIAGATKEILKQAGSIAEINAMNPIQQKALEQATGLTVEQMTKAYELEKKTAKMLADPKKKAAYDKAQKDMANLNQMNEDSLLTDLQKNVATEQWTNALNKITTIFSTLLLPAIEGAVSLISAIMTPITYVANVLGDITSAFKTANGELSLMQVIVTSIGAGMLAIAASGKAIAAYTAITTALKEKGMWATLKDTASSIAGAIAKMTGAAALSFGATLAIGLAAAAATAGALYAYNSKADDMIQPGYGARSIVSDKGTIALNDKDTIVAGTDLLPKDNKTKQTNIPSTNVDTSKIEEKLERLISILSLSRDINLDGQKVGAALGVNIAHPGMATS